MRDLSFEQLVTRRNVFEQNKGSERPRDIGNTFELLVAMPLTEQHRDSILKLSKQSVDSRNYPDHQMFLCTMNWSWSIISNHVFEKEYIIRRAERGILFVEKK